MSSFFEMARKNIWIVGEKDFAGLLKGGINSAAKYFAGILAAGMLLTFVYNYLATSGDIAVSLLGVAVDLFLVYILGVALVLPFLTHLVLKLMGGKRPLGDTMQMYIYASTPSVLLGWVPCLGIFAYFVSFGNLVRGLKAVNKMPLWKALVAVLLPGVLFAAALVLVGIAVLSYFTFSEVATGPVMVS